MFLRRNPTIPCDWRNTSFPTRGAAPPEPEPSTSTSGHSSSPSATGSAHQDKIKELLVVYKSCVDILFSMEVDPIKHYQENKAEHLLQKIVAGNKKFSICENSYSSIHMF